MQGLALVCALKNEIIDLERGAFQARFCQAARRERALLNYWSVCPWLSRSRRSPTPIFL
jgi:hypothetical protein